MYTPVFGPHSPVATLNDLCCVFQMFPAPITQVRSSCPPDVILAMNSEPLWPSGLLQLPQTYLRFVTVLLFSHRRNRRISLLTTSPVTLGSAILPKYARLDTSFALMRFSDVPKSCTAVSWDERLGYNTESHVKSMFRASASGALRLALSLKSNLDHCAPRPSAFRETLFPCPRDIYPLHRERFV